MNEYRIEKLRRTVCVVQCDGRRLDGDVFVRLHARLHHGPEEPLDHFNDETAFFALSRPSGEVLLVSKDQVALVEFPAPPADTSLEPPHDRVDVEVTLCDGSSMTGTLFPETRADRARLLDYLNAYQPPFLPVFGRERTWLVNRRMIAHVKQLS
jgi:hypothetical protein